MSDKIFNCDICNTSFTRKDGLTRHNATTSHKIKAGLEQPVQKIKQEYKCDKCDFKSDRKFNLDRHKPTHDNIHCEYCDFTYAKSTHDAHIISGIHFDNVSTLVFRCKRTINIIKYILGIGDERYDFKFKYMVELPKVYKNMSKEEAEKLLHLETNKLKGLMVDFKITMTALQERDKERYELGLLPINEEEDD